MPALTGIGLVNPTFTANSEHANSKQITALFTTLIVSQCMSTFQDLDGKDTRMIKAAIRKAKHEKQDEEAKAIYNQLHPGCL